MAKLALLFVVIFVAIQLTLAASRIPRDLDETKVQTEDPFKDINAFFESTKKTIGDALTKEKLDAAVESLTAIGEKLKQAGADLVSTVRKSTEEAAAKSD